MWARAEGERAGRRKNPHPFFSPPWLNASCFGSARGAQAPTTPFREAYLICGRRAGKSFVLALIAVFLACFRGYDHVSTTESYEPVGLVSAHLPKPVPS